jgi:hypothetical protein
MSTAWRAAAARAARPRYSHRSRIAAMQQAGAAQQGPGAAAAAARPRKLRLLRDEFRQWWLWLLAGVGLLSVASDLLS